MDFYDIIDTYARVHDIEPAEVLHLWYRGVITAKDLLGADLEDEGIFDYLEHYFNVIKILTKQHIKDHGRDPWLD